MKLTSKNLPFDILPVPFRALGASLLLLHGGAALAQDIDLTQPCSNAPATIYAPLNSPLAVNVGASNAPVGNLEWSFDAVPAGFAGVSCSGANPVDCNGAIVTLPAPAPASQTTLTGTPTSGEGGFAMTLEATVGSTGCTRDYFVDFVEPFQTVLVLDRSGSMGSSTHITPPATSRWNALELSVNNFSSHFVNAGEASNSELGITLFNGNVIPNNSFPATLQTITASLPGDIATELGSQSPGGATAIGKGVQDALVKFTNPANPRAVLLFTDGEQNVSPYVQKDGLFLNANSDENDCVAPGPDCTEIPTDISFVTIGIGQPSGDYLDMLTGLASSHNGYSIITSNSEDFTWANGMGLGDVEAAFNNAIAPVLSSNSPQMVAFNTGELVGSNPISLPSFELNRQLASLVIQVSYSSRFETPQLAMLLAGIRVEKDGSDITGFFTPRIVGNFSNGITLATDFTAADSVPDSIDPQGSYTIQMVKPPNFKDLGLKVTTFADDHQLDMRWRVSPARPRVMDDFQTQMTLQWAGVAIESADVRAFVLKPGDDLGHLLATYGGTIDPSSMEDAGTAGYQKYLHLIENDPDFLAQLLPAEQQLTLTHQGGGGYSANFNPGDVSGVYQVLYSVNHNSAETGVVERLAAQSVFVRFGEVDLENSEITTSVQGTTTTVTMRPISIVGKFIGPGQQNTIKFRGGTVTVADVTDHQDGRYTYVLEGDATQDVEVTVLGDTIHSGALENFNSEVDPTINGDGLPAWAWWMLILLVLLGLLLMIWRVLSGGTNP